MTDAERQMRRGLSALLLEAPVAVVRDLSALVQAREEELLAEIKLLRIRCEKLHVVAKNVGNALMSFTPGGSEYFTRIQVGDWEDYYADADACQRRVRDRITKAEESLRERYRTATGHSGGATRE